MNKASSLCHNYLNFIHAEQHLLIMARSQPPSGQIPSARQTKLPTTSWTSAQGFPSVACVLLRHLLHLKLGSSISISVLSEHLLTQNQHPLEKVEFLLTPFVHTAQGYLPMYEGFQCMEISSLDYNYDFCHTAIFVMRPSNVSTIITRSSA